MVGGALAACRTAHLLLLAAPRTEERVMRGHECHEKGGVGRSYEIRWEVWATYDSNYAKFVGGCNEVFIKFYENFNII
jgi:hypothetical protein